MISLDSKPTWPYVKSNCPLKLITDRTTVGRKNCSQTFVITCNLLSCRILYNLATLDISEVFEPGLLMALK